jgi:hypothetical protein
MTKPTARWRIARSDVFWWLGSFVALQVGLAVALESLIPSWRDPAYAAAETRLRVQKKQAPDRPILVMLGTSRTLNGLRPTVLPDGGQGDGATPAIHNWGFPGHGPVELAMRLDHLVREGPRPDGLVIELVPSMLPREQFGPKTMVPNNAHSWKDLPTVAALSTSGKEIMAEWREARLMPWFGYRDNIMDSCLPRWRPRGQSNTWWKALDSSGWMPIGVSAPSSKALELAVDSHKPFLQQAHVAPCQERALRHILATCKREHIPVALLLMPEGPVFRNLYSEQTRACWDGFMTSLCQEFEAPLVDARDWINSEEYFLDSHHLLPEGARVFTERFAREVVPLVMRENNSDLARAK